MKSIFQVDMSFLRLDMSCLSTEETSPTQQDDYKHSQSLLDLWFLV